MALAQTTAHLPGLKVGICWKGNPQFLRDAERSPGLAACTPLFAPYQGMCTIHWFALQAHGRDEFLAAAGAAGVDLGHEIDSVVTPFAETAALIMQLDLVISCDTVIAHLAGALGKPVWLLLPLLADWRWMDQRSDSPWYPHTRLLRQSRRGDWAELMQRVRNEISIVLTQHEAVHASSSSESNP